MHNLISFTISGVPHLNQQSISHIPQFIFSKGDYDSLNEFLDQSDFSQYYMSKDIEFLWSSLKSIILSGCNQHVPKSRRLKSSFPKWYDGNILSELKYVRRLQKKVCSSNSVSNTMSLKAAELSLFNNMTDAKSSYEDKLVLGIATLFNEFFFSIFTATSTLSDFLPSNDHYGNPISILDDMEISVSDVFECLISLDVNKAMGIWYSELCFKILFRITLCTYSSSVCSMC